MISISKRRLAGPVIALVAVIAVAGVASATSPGSLQKFGTGKVTVTGAAGATLVNRPGEYSGVYIKSVNTNSAKAGSQADKSLALADYSFAYSGDTAGGAPRFSIPVKTDVAGETPYIFIDALNCGTPGLVSTADLSCAVFVNTGGSYANWDALAAANPTWMIDSARIPFVIADYQGKYIISNINLN